MPEPVAAAGAATVTVERAGDAVDTAEAEELEGLVAGRWWRRENMCRFNREQHSGPVDEWRMKRGRRTGSRAPWRP